MLSYLLVLLATMFLTQVAIVATSVYLHRTLAHRSVAVHPAAELLFRAILWITTGQRRQEWVAVHRKHHAFTDREGDPHSPKMHGFWNIQLFNVYYYAREARNAETLEKYARDLVEDRWERFIFKHGPIGVGIGITALCAIFGFGPGLAIAGLHAILYVFVVAPLINGLGHWRGQKNFDNTACNSRLLALVTGGESLHNNHHEHPRAPRFSMKRFELDPSWLVVRALAAVRLVRVTGSLVNLPG